MKQIQPTSVEVLRNDGFADQWTLTHDGKRVIGLAKPGTRVGCGVNHSKDGRAVMLVGTEAELRAEIARLGLEEKRTAKAGK